MQNSRKMTVAATLALLIALGFGIKGGLDFWEKRQNQAAYEAILPYTKAPEIEDFNAQMDALRTFINTHSEHKIDALFKSYWRDSREIARRMLAYAKGETKDKLHMECSTRSEMMGAFVKALGYRTRPVVVYGVQGGILLSHTFLEIKNPENEEWQVQDPDLDLYYIVKDSGKRASITDLIRLDFDALKPCNSIGKCGWDIKSPEDFPATKMHKYMGLASINDYQAGKRPLVNNPARFDLEKLVTYRKTEAAYCEHLQKNCKGEILMLQ